MAALQHHEIQRAFTLACMRGDLHKVLRMLKEHPQIDVNMDSVIEGQTVLPLHATYKSKEAPAEPRVKIIHILLGKGAVPYDPDDAGFVPAFPGEWTGEVTIAREWLPEIGKLGDDHAIPPLRRLPSHLSGPALKHSTSTDPSNSP
jgi:hypothetical protein